MGRLQKKLDAIKAGMARQAPAQVLETMHAATAALQADVDARGLDFVGKPLPPFALKDSETGDVVTLESLMGGGPLVITLFRGSW